MAIFHDMIEKTMEVFMDDFSVFGDSFSTFLSHLEKRLKRCDDTNLALNWEKSHFMVKEGIVLGHKISKSRIEVDRAKVEVITKFPHPTTMKGVKGKQEKDKIETKLDKNGKHEIFCQHCTCKSCGKGAHIGYNCPPRVPIISNPEPCNQIMNNGLPQTLPSFDSTCYSNKENPVPYVSKHNFVDKSSNIFNPPPQPPIYYCELCESNAQYGHYCTPQAPFINPEPGDSQDFNFPQNIHDFQQQYLCCDQCGGPHETFQ
nr:reverse transcriptase domain-containing protein [Tanacetum cinerariifolium]